MSIGHLVVRIGGVSRHPQRLRAARRCPLQLVDELDLDGYYLLHGIRAELLARLGRNAEAAAAYESAIGRTDSPAQIRFLSRRLAALPG